MKICSGFLQLQQLGPNKAISIQTWSQVEIAGWKDVGDGVCVDQEGQEPLGRSEMLPAPAKAAGSP